MKINFNNFNSLVRAAMMIGGTVATFKPELGPTIQNIGGIAAGVGVLWGQINAVIHPHKGALPNV